MVMTDRVALEVLDKATAKFRIGDKVFTMKPITPRKLRKLANILSESGVELKELKQLNDILSLLMSKVLLIFPVLFDEDITQEFVDDNLTIPLCREMWDTFVKLNTLEDILPFFVRTVQIKEVDKN